MFTVATYCVSSAPNIAYLLCARIFFSIDSLARRKGFMAVRVDKHLLTERRQGKKCRLAVFAEKFYAVARPRYGETIPIKTVCKPLFLLKADATLIIATILACFTKFDNPLIPYTPIF